jgi:Ca2+-transporting ATPase
MTKPTAKIIRDGMVTEVRAETLVPGDLVLVDAGDFVPADARLVESASLQVNESVLTGESVPVEKSLTSPGPGDIPIGDRTNMLFMGTTVTGGRGQAVVVATGQATQLGQIAEMLSAVAPEPTPLQQQLGQLGKQLGMAAGLIVAIIFLTGLWRGEEVLGMFMTAVSLAVAAVPEGLPAIVTIVLALGVTRMSHRQVIIRKLPAVETLGTATYICSDKTGTLTKNEMTVKGIHTADESFQVTGTGYRPRGEFLDEKEREIDPSAHDHLQLMLLGGLLNNDSQLENGDNYRIIGDPTEGALVVAAAKAGLTREEAGENYPRLAEIPFDSQRKLMTTFHRLGEGIRAFTKGAPDVLLDRCTRVLRAGGEKPLTGEERTRLLEINRNLASRGERVLALGLRRWPEVPDKPEPEAVEQDLTFVGFFSMQDPARPEAAEAVEVSRQAGIRTVMITGDHPETATAIARDLGILQPGDRVLTGSQVNELDEEGLREAVLQTSVYARVSRNTNCGL